MEKNKINNEAGITLIALVIVIIILLILAGISISMLTGENGLITKATQAATETDIAETKEKIKLEVMGSINEEGKYTNVDVVNAVKKVTGKQVEEKTTEIQTEKGNIVDLSDLWIEEKVNLITFWIDEDQYQVKEGTTWEEFLRENPVHNLVEGEHRVEDKYREGYWCVDGSSSYGDAALGYFEDVLFGQGGMPVGINEDIVNNVKYVIKNVNHW